VDHQQACGAPERSISAHSAIELALQYAAMNGVSLNVQQLGLTLKTTRCDAIDASGRTASGLGKGIGTQSKASAIFEAFEHYYSLNEESTESAETVPLDLAGADAELLDGSPNFASICGQRRIPLGRISFASIDNSASILRFPAFLTNPYYRPTSQPEADALATFSLTRYTTNSGTSSGVTRDEALLHGALEVIERDSIGVELLRTIIRREPFAVREIAKHTLPPPLSDLCLTAEKETEGVLTLWDITTDIGVPTFLAALSRGEPLNERHFGSGASLYPSYALERAVLETVQSVHAREMRSLPRPRSGSQSLTGMPLFARCLLESGFFAYRGGAASVSYTDVSAPIGENITVDVSAQLSAVESLLQARGFKLYWRSIVPGPIHVTQVVVPKLERFHLVSHGTPVAPGGRGRAVLAC
jgi:ribosomal protein S12 methylthiotransferase accessory factor